MKKIKKGFTLTEVLLVLGIAAIIIIIIFLTLPKVIASSKASQDAKNVVFLQSAIRGIYNGQASYSGVSTDVLLKAKVVPDNMIANPEQGSGSDIINAFSGKVYIGIVTNGFSIALANIPPDACVKIVTAAASSFYQVTANSVNVKAYYSTPQMDITNVTTQCAKTENNYLIFYSN